jgi:predicted metal-dependent hydrolase
MATLSKNDLERADRPIPVRTPAFDFESGIPTLWFRNNSFLTFFFNGLNLTFPEGERVFVRAVNDHKHLVTDPVLLAQIKGFSGQEGAHARAHEQLFDSLRAQGFDLAPFFDRYLRYVRYMNKNAPAASRLAATAALEHYTSTLALLMFELDLLREAHPEMRKLLLWHATEELEHRAVAFDVLRATRPGYALRAYGFVVGSISLAYWLAVGMRLFVKQSEVPMRTLWRDFMRVEALAGYRLGWRIAKALLLYLKPGFHPNQVGSLEAPLAMLAAEGITTP